MYAAGRITHLQPMHWENDWPIIGVNKEGIDYVNQLMNILRPIIENTEKNLRPKKNIQYVSQTQQMNLIPTR